VPSILERARARAGSLTSSLRAALPFSGAPQPAGARVPPPAWYSDQPPPPPSTVKFIPGYHDHTFSNFAAPLAFDGWTIDRIRNAVALHDQGIFLESNALMINIMRFAPVITALGQAIAPAVALPRRVLGGTRGLSRILAADVERQLCPRGGLLPSPYFPPTLWGSMAIELRMMGFTVLQHVEGDPDPITGVRPMYTRRWPSWAVNYYRYRRTFVAQTDAGPFDIVSGDGKFTLIADDEEPLYWGAVRQLGLEVFIDLMGDQAWGSFLNRYGNPKLWAEMPPNVGASSDVGDKMMLALATIRGPDGFGVLPNGAKLTWAQLAASQSQMFEANDKVRSARISGVLLGSDGTVSAGTGGVYQSPMFWGVRRDHIDRMLKAMVRGINMGHVAPFLSMNYEASISVASGWVPPVLDIPLPDPEGDARIKSYGERRAAFTTQIDADRKAGIDVTQEHVDQLAMRFEVDTVMLAARAANVQAIALAPTDVAKVVRVDEARASQGLGPIGDERGQLTIGQLDAYVPPAGAPGAAPDATLPDGRTVHVMPTGASEPAMTPPDDAGEGDATAGDTFEEDV